MAASVHIAGFQEARNPKSLVEKSAHICQYSVASSAGVKGELGCELWISRKRPFGQINGEDVLIAIGGLSRRPPRVHVQFLARGRWGDRLRVASLVLFSALCLGARLARIGMLPHVRVHARPPIACAECPVHSPVADVCRTMYMM